MNAEEKKAWEKAVEVAQTVPSLFLIKPPINEILAAYAELTRLSALEERCGDVEGIHLAIRCEWATKTDSKLAAHRVSRFLKEG